MSADFSIADLFEKAFGYKSEAFNVEHRSPREDNSATDKKKEFSYNPKADKPVAVRTNSIGGTPLYATANNVEYYLPVTITAYGYDSGSKSWNVQKDPFDLPHPIVSVKSQKKIIETELTEGNRGTFKELINQGDYEINIKGLCIGDDGEFPDQLIKSLRELYECGAPVSIKNALTDIFLVSSLRQGKDSIVIKDLSFPEVRGVKHVFAYEMSCVSDSPFDLLEV